MQQYQMSSPVTVAGGQPPKEATWNAYLHHDATNTVAILNNLAANVLGANHLRFIISEIADYETDDSDEDEIFGFFAGTRMAGEGTQSLAEAIHAVYGLVVPEDCFVYMIHPAKIEELQKAGFHDSAEIQVMTLGNVMRKVMWMMNRDAPQRFARMIASSHVIGHSLPMLNEAQRADYVAYCLDDDLGYILEEEVSLRDLLTDGSIAELNAIEDKLSDFVVAVATGAVVLPYRPTSLSTMVHLINDLLEKEVGSVTSGVTALH